MGVHVKANIYTCDNCDNKVEEFSMPKWWREVSLCLLQEGNYHQLFGHKLLVCDKCLPKYSLFDEDKKPMRVNLLKRLLRIGRT